MRKGFTIILCLLLSLLLLVIVLGMLGTRGPMQEVAAGTRQHAQARALAEAGMEDVRVKLGKDLKFPPVPTPDQPFFSYAESVYDVDDTVVGAFQVKIDQSLDQAPYYVLRVTSSGLVGPVERPLAHVTLLRRLDSCPFLRTDPTQINPLRFQVLSQEELP